MSLGSERAQGKITHSSFLVLAQYTSHSIRAKGPCPWAQMGLGQGKGGLVHWVKVENEVANRDTAHRTQAQSTEHEARNMHLSAPVRTSDRSPSQHEARAPQSNVGPRITRHFTLPRSYSLSLQRPLCTQATGSQEKARADATLCICLQTTAWRTTITKSSRAP